MNYQEAQAFALYHHSNILKLRKFIAINISPVREKTFLPSDIYNAVHRNAAIYGLQLRAEAWLHSLERLNNGVDLQAVITSVRALLEIATDSILLYHDKTNESGWRMVNWEDSAKLKSAKLTLDFFANRLNQNLPSEFKPMADFIDKEEPFITRIRKQLGWTKAKDQTIDRHPERWTMRSTLLDDVKEADRLHETQIKRHFGSNFEYFYETEYRRLNWNIHGSGLGGVRTLDKSDVEINRAIGYWWSAKLILVCIDIMLRELLDRDIPNLDNILSEFEYLSVIIQSEK